jgi:AraC-like DNA-binding protein
VRRLPVAGDVGRQLVEALPPVLHLPHVDDDPLHDAIGLLSRELATPAPGQQTVLDRLLDVVLVHALRASLRQAPQAPRWYQAATDPRLDSALRAIHCDAAHPWTVPELAALSGLSRAAFARAFQHALGQAPMQYLSEWRMTLARDQLRAGDRSLAQIASRTGYSSPYAFAAAFRRHHGQPPGRWRQGHDDPSLSSRGDPRRADQWLLLRIGGSPDVDAVAPTRWLGSVAATHFGQFRGIGECLLLNALCPDVAVTSGVEAVIPTPSLRHERDGVRGVREKRLGRGQWPEKWRADPANARPPLPPVDRWSR